MTIPSLGRGGLPVYSPTSSTATATNGSRTVTFTGTALVTTDPTTGALTYAAGVGDTFVVQGVGAKVIESVDSATQITLCDPWSAATQTAVTNYYIVRNSVPAFGYTAKAIQDILALGSDTSPDTARTIDDGTARIKVRPNSGQPDIAVGPTGTADGSLLSAIRFRTAAGIAGAPQGMAEFPNGMKEYVLGFRNRLINGGFDIWQQGTSMSPGFGQYTADQWTANYTAPSPTVNRVSAPAGFRPESPNAAQIVVTEAAAGNILDFSQRLRGRQIQSLDSQPAVFAFDLNATTTAGTLSGTVIIVANTALDNGTFSNILASIPFTIPVGSGRVIVPLTAAQTAGLKNGGSFTLHFAQSGATGNWTIYIGSVQLEKGAVANDFEYRPYDVELLLCKRFFRRETMNLRAAVYSSGFYCETNIAFDMWATPTASLVSGASRSGIVGPVALIPVSSTCARFGFGPTTGAGDAYALADIWDLSARL